VRRENNDAPIYAGFDGRPDAVSLGDFGLVSGSSFSWFFLAEGCGVLTTRASGK
jgi:hypothetical protein